MIGPLTRLLGLVGILFMYLWPRYFYVNIAGKGVSGFTLFTMLLLAASMFLLLFRAPLRRAVVASAIRAAPVLTLFWLWWLWRIACDAMGETPAASYGATFLDFLYLGSWAIIGSVFFKDARFRTAFPYMVAVSGVVATVFGLIEQQMRMPLSTLLGFADLQAGDQVGLAKLKGITTRGEITRVHSLFTHPLVYGQVMASMTPVALYFFLHVRGVRKLIGIALAFCIVASVIMSNARSPFIVAAAAAVVYFMLFYFDPRQNKRLFVFLWALMGLAIAVPTASGVLVNLISGRTSEEAISSIARDRQLTMGRAALMDSPVNGYGDGNAGHYAGIIGDKGVITVDNYYLTAAVDSGYLGLALLLSLLLAVVVYGIALCLKLSVTATRGLACIAISTSVGLTMGLMILSITDTLSFIFLMIGCLVAVGDTGSTPLLGLGVGSMVGDRRGRSLRVMASSRPARSVDATP